MRRETSTLHGSISRRVQAQSRQWQQLHKAGTVHDVRIAVGGMATTPWRLPRVERALRGRRLDAALCREAANLAAEGAVPRGQNAYKTRLIGNTVARALMETGGVA